MESKLNDANSAALLLQRHEEVRSRIGQRGPSRGYEWLLVWSALLLSVYVGVFLYAFSGFEARTAIPGGYLYTNLMLLPVLLFSGLVSGARDRFSIRSRSSVSQALAYVAAIVVFVLLGALNLVGVGYPWWLNLVAPAALFAALATAPVRRLLAARSTHSEHWSVEPMTAPARCATAAIGVAFGVLAATSTLGMFPIVSAVTLLVTLGAALISWRLPWGLARTGFQWAPAHWVLFAIATAAMFALATALSTSDVVTSGVAFATGAFTCAVMGISAFVPFRTSAE